MIYSLVLELQEAVGSFDPEAQSVLEECREALEKEDVAYLAQHSPNPYERAFYRAMLPNGK